MNQQMVFVFRTSESESDATVRIINNVIKPQWISLISLKIAKMRKILLEGFLCLIFVIEVTHAMHILPFMNTNADNLNTNSKVSFWKIDTNSW